MDGIVRKSASTLEKLCYGRTVLIPIINLRRIAWSETQRKCGQAMCLLLIINRFFFIVWVSSFNPLLGRTRSRGRCRAAIRLSHRPEPSGRAIHGQVDGLDSEGQYGQPVYSSATHSQAAEEAITHLFKQEWKRPTPVRRRLSPTQALLGRAIPGVWVPMSGIKVRSLVAFSNHSAFHRWPAQSAARLLLSSAVADPDQAFGGAVK